MAKKNKREGVEKSPDKSIKNKSKQSKTEEAKRANKQQITNEEIADYIVNDDQWQCTITLFVFQSQPLYDHVLFSLSDLPKHFTIITKDTISLATSGKDKTNGKRSKSKSPSKSQKTKGTDKRENNKVISHESLNQNSQCTNLCLQIKSLIIKLKSDDVSGIINDEERDQLTKKPVTSNKATNQKQISEAKQSATAETEESSPIKHRFIILAGFEESLMFQELSRLLIPVIAVLQFIGDEPDITRLSIQSNSEKRKESGKGRKNVLEENQKHDFLSEINKLRKDESFMDNNIDLMFLNFIISNYNTSKSEEYKNKLKGEILSLSYKVKESWEEFIKYKKIIKIVAIPNVETILQLENANLYSTMISMVPLECASIAVVLHCIVEQVAWWSEGQVSVTRSSDHTNGKQSLDLSDKPADNIKYSTSITSDVHSTSVLNNIKHSTSITSDVQSTSVLDNIKHSTSITSDAHSTSVLDNITHSTSITSDMHSTLDLDNITPLLIDDRDLVKQSVFHLQLPELDFDSITTNMNKKSPIYNLWKIFTPQTLPTVNWYDYQKKKIKKYTEDHFIFKKQYHSFLEQSVLNLLILNFYDIPRIDDIDNEEYVLAQEVPCERNVNYFIQTIVYEIINKVPRISAVRKNKRTPFGYSELNKFLTTSEKSFPEKSLLQKKQDFLKEQFSYFKSFLIEKDFSGYFTEMLTLKQKELFADCLKQYEFIQVMGPSAMSQSVQSAFQKFANVNYDYFLATDSILLWFNNYTTRADTISSRSVGGVLETPLGFRDFYNHKLKEQTIYSDVFLSNIDDINLFTEPELQDNKKSYDTCTTNHYHPDDLIVYDIASSRITVSETCKYFCSCDGSNVIVKRIKNFDNKFSILVTVSKNNCQLRYEFDPVNQNKSKQLFIDIENKMLINCMLDVGNAAPEAKEKNINRDFSYPTLSFGSTFSLKLNSRLTITLESGLLVEIIPVNSDYLGRFYVRQTYLEKGPTCSKIWEERSRCYFKNGTVVVFHNNKTDILYSNGTIVRCNAFEPFVFEVLEEKLKDLSENLKTKDPKSKNNKNQPEKVDDQKTQKEGKDKKVKTSIRSRKKMKKESIKTKDEKLEEEIKLEVNHEFKNDIPKYKITDHTVISWNGNITEFKNGKLSKEDNVQNLKLSFDHINQELYMIRSDGLSSLFCPENLTITFPDESKTTVYIEDWTDITGKPNEDNGEFQPASSKANYLSSSSLDNNGDNFISVDTQYRFEHDNYATVKYNPNCEVEILLPGNVNVQVDEDGLFEIDLNGNETFRLRDNIFSFEASVLRDSSNKSITTLRFENILSSLQISCLTVDSFDNEFYVDSEGETFSHLRDQETSTTCTPYFQHNVEQFFVLNRDLTGYEMLNQPHQDNYFLGRNEDNSIKVDFNNHCERELFSLYNQIPIYKTKSEEYMMDTLILKKLPTLIRSKDLINVTPSLTTIWFTPLLSIQNHIENEKEKTVLPVAPKAMCIRKVLKIKNSDSDISSMFFNILREYTEAGKNLYYKYLNYFPEEKRNPSIDELGRQHTQLVFGSQSYYLSDNLPQGTKDEVLSSLDTNFEQNSCNILEIAE